MKNASAEKVKAPAVKKKAAKYNRITVFDIVLYIIMILFMACIILPFVNIISVSVSEMRYVVTGEVGLWPKGWDPSAYVKVFEEGGFLRAYGNTIWYTVVGTALSLVTTAMAAYALSRRRLVGHGIFSLMITITMFFGGGLIPTYLVVSKLGLDNTRWVMIIPGLISTWNLIVMRSFFAAYPQEIIESGMMDGLRDPGVFLRLVLPTSKAALATIGLYYAVGYWNNYMTARIYIRDETLYPVMHMLQKMVGQLAAEDTQGTDGTTLTAATIRNASIVVVVTPIMCVYPFIQKHFVKGVMVGSIKG